MDKEILTTAEAAKILGVSVRTAQLLIEGGVLIFLGATLAVLFAVWSLDVIIALTPRTVPRFQETRIDYVVLIFTAVIAVVLGFLESEAICRS